MEYCCEISMIFLEENNHRDMVLGLANEKICKK